MSSLKNSTKFPGGLALLTHVRGIGKMEGGVEKPRIDVILASSHTKEECQKINFDHMDYNDIDIEMYKDREDEGILFVVKAGEVLHKVKTK